MSDVKEGEYIPSYNYEIGQTFTVDTMMEERRVEGKKNPIQVMLEAMDTARETDNVKAAVQIAAMVAPYVHAKLASVTVTTSPVPPKRVELLGADELKSLVRGRIEHKEG